MQEHDWIALKEALDCASWTELCRILSISERQLRRYRRGQDEPPAKLLLAIEGALCRRFHQKRTVDKKRFGAPRFAWERFMAEEVPDKED